MSEIKVRGVVKFFDNPKGYGFIINDDGVDVFAHYSSILCEGYRSLNDGDLVEYIEVMGDKGLQALKISKIT